MAEIFDTKSKLIYVRKEKDEGVCDEKIRDGLIPIAKELVEILRTSGCDCGVALPFENDEFEEGKVHVATLFYCQQDKDKILAGKNLWEEMFKESALNF